jgi:hypothetical protein
MIQHTSYVRDIVSRSKDHRMKTSLLLVVLALIIALALTVCASVRLPFHVNEVPMAYPIAAPQSTGS